MEENPILKASLSMASDIPLYAQLTGIIKNTITSGTLRVGDLLPSEAELCDKFEISRNTVRQAIGSLEEAGFVVRKRGKGTFVTGEEHRKYAVSDLCLIPRYAVLDPTLTLSLPPAVTAQTGMDALTHAVEAYLSLYYNTRETRALAESAVRDIFRYLPVACRDGQSLTARERMLRASFDAGCAFTRASVGNVHAIAHTLGGLYGIPHGLACAVTLPVVLEDYGAAVHPHLARLGSLIGLTGTERERAVGFLAAIRALNASLGIPDRFDGIRGEDLPRMAAWAAAETNPVYPVPVVYDQARFRRVLERLRA